MSSFRFPNFSRSEGRISLLTEQNLARFFTCLKGWLRSFPPTRRRALWLVSPESSHTNASRGDSHSDPAFGAESKGSKPYLRSNSYPQ